MQNAHSMRYLQSYDLLLSHLGIWVELLHFCVVKVGVYDALPAGSGGRAAVPYAVAYERCGGDKDIGSHEGHQDPGGYVPGGFWDLLDPGCEVRVEPFDPHDGSNAPEKAVEQIDAAAQIEGNLTVVRRRPRERCR